MTKQSATGSDKAFKMPSKGAATVAVLAVLLFAAFSLMLSAGASVPTPNAAPQPPAPADSGIRADSAAATDEALSAGLEAFEDKEASGSSPDLQPRKFDLYDFIRHTRKDDLNRGLQRVLKPEIKPGLFLNSGPFLKFFSIAKDVNKGSVGQSRVVEGFTFVKVDTDQIRVDEQGQYVGTIYIGRDRHKDRPAVQDSVFFYMKTKSGTVRIAYASVGKDAAAEFGFHEDILAFAFSDLDGIDHEYIVDDHGMLVRALVQMGEDFEVRLGRVRDISKGQTACLNDEVTYRGRTVRKTRVCE
jgi:hypothetical protein